jgi:hypothetical protein
MGSREEIELAKWAGVGGVVMRSGDGGFKMSAAAASRRREREMRVISVNRSISQKSNRELPLAALYAYLCVEEREN